MKKIPNILIIETPLAFFSRTSSRSKKCDSFLQSRANSQDTSFEHVQPVDRQKRVAR